MNRNMRASLEDRPGSAVDGPFSGKAEGRSEATNLES
jgi:hypothetical protein